MKVLSFILAVVALGVCAFYAEIRWSVVRWPIELRGPSVNAQQIRSHFPVRLISPGWIDAKGDELERRWRLYEFLARTAVVFLGWLGVVFLVWWGLRRGDSASKSLQATAAPPGS